MKGVFDARIGGGCSLLRTSLCRNSLFKRENTGKILTKFPSTLLHTHALPHGSSASRQPVSINSNLKQGIIRELTGISQKISFQRVQFLGRISYPCRSKKTIKSIRTNIQERHLAQRQARHSAPKKYDAIDFLKNILRNGPVSLEEINEAACADDIAWATVRRAYDALNIEAIKEKKFQGKWLWHTPEQAAANREQGSTT